ncbi:hypothetical protein ACFZ8E_24855 [Methylobacterium sp. HMF5984]|uniref:hypothetical protein n=1 Tax=Methylobacterium sp. HMF5984 TaxID=3367370 RepID=UPI0038545315
MVPTWQFIWTKVARQGRGGALGDEDEIEAAFVEALETCRPWQGFWTGCADRAVAERVNAGLILEAAGHQVRDLRSRVGGEDPPDCEGWIDARWCGVEVTELIDQKTLKASLKGREQFLMWTGEQLVDALQDRVRRKDKAWKGGPYERNFLVILTDEFALTSDVVHRHLRGEAFRAELLTDLHLGLSYEPSPNPSDQPGLPPALCMPLNSTLGASAVVSSSVDLPATG